jgi:hypothetical protein
MEHAALVVQINEQPTLWGLHPHELHERFWAAKHIQIVRRGEQHVLAPDARALAERAEALERDRAALQRAVENGDDLDDSSSQ